MPVQHSTTPSPPTPSRPNSFWACRTPGELLDVGLGTAYWWATLPFHILSLDDYLPQFPPPLQTPSTAVQRPTTLEDLRYKTNDEVRHLDASIMDCEQKIAQAAAQEAQWLERAREADARHDERALRRAFEGVEVCQDQQERLENTRLQLSRLTQQLRRKVDILQHSKVLDDAVATLASLDQAVGHEAVRNDTVERALIHDEQLQDRVVLSATPERAAAYDRFKAQLRQPTATELLESLPQLPGIPVVAEVAPVKVKS